MELNVYNDNKVLSCMSAEQKARAIDKTKRMYSEIKKLNEDQAKVTLKMAAEVINMHEAIIETKDKQLLLTAEQAVLFKGRVTDLEQENESLSETNKSLEEELRKKSEGDPEAVKRVSNLMRASRLLAEKRVATRDSDICKPVADLLDETLRLATL